MVPAWLSQRGEIAGHTAHTSSLTPAPAPVANNISRTPWRSQRVAAGEKETYLLVFKVSFLKAEPSSACAVGCSTHARVFMIPGPISSSSRAPFSTIYCSARVLCRART